MKAILWVQKGKNKHASKAENSARKDAAEQGGSACKGRTELKLFKWIPGESIGRRKRNLISKKKSNEFLKAPGAQGKQSFGFPAEVAMTWHPVH